MSSGIERSLPNGDRDDEDPYWTAERIAQDIHEWNKNAKNEQEKIDIFNPVHPEMYPQQKQNVIHYLTAHLREQTDVVASVVAPSAIWAVSELNGWHNPPCDLTTDLLLIHSEVSEACEALRAGKLRMSDGDDSVEEELADIVIRVFHTAAKNKMDILGAIQRKHTKNKARPYRHGGKAF